MSLLKPIPEAEASGETLEIYQSVKQTLGLHNVPVIFQYLAVFPKYLEFIWQQAVKNLNDKRIFKPNTRDRKLCPDCDSDSFCTFGTHSNIFRKIKRSIRKTRTN